LGFQQYIIDPIQRGVQKKEHIRVVFDIIPLLPDPRYSSERV
jgi:hypothetical protein